jgi:hypothetical protein
VSGGPPSQSACGPDARTGYLEIRVDDFIVVLEGRVVEFFHLESDYTERIHVAQFGAEAKPHGDGAKVRVGKRRPGHEELNVGAGRISMKLDAAEWAEFQRFVAAVKAAQ